MLFTVLYLIGISAEAMTGALAAGRRRMDAFGVIIIANVTAIGGGSVRDMLLGHYPLGWVRHPEYIVIVTVAAVATIFVAPLMTHLRSVFLVLDALGLAVFATIGAQTALDSGHSAIIAVISAVITGVFGGILRDMLCNKVPLVFQKELYGGIAFTVGWIYVFLLKIPVDREIAATVALFAGFAIRLLALYFSWGLPIFDYSDKE